MAANLSCLLDRLPNSENKMNTLNEIKTLISSLDRSSIADVLPNISLNVIFECFDTQEEGQLESCVEVLDKLLDSMSGLALLNQHEAEVLLALEHPYKPLRLLALKQVLRAAEESIHTFVSSHSSLILTLSQMNYVPELDVAKKAAQVLLMTGTIPEGLEALLLGNAFDSLQAALNKNDSTMKFRTYELLVDLCRYSEDALRAVSSRGLLDQLLNELQGDDVLAKLNSLELMSRLASCPHGLSFLENSGSIETVQQMLHHSDPLKGLLMPGMITFLGQMAANKPESINTTYQPFVNTVFGALEADDSSLIGVAVETIGVIGSSAAGKVALQKQGNRMSSACRVLGQLLRSSPDLKTKVLETLASLLSIKVGEPSSEQLSITQQWFSSLCRSQTEALNLLNQSSTNPELTLHCAVLKVYQCMAVLPWAQSVLNSHPGFNEYLIDRSTESTKEGKEMKYAIVKSLVDSPTAMDVFGRVYFVRLREFINEGPFFIRVESSVAFESTD